jgi:DNA end-binding protein Ku
MAKALVNSLAAKWDPAKYTDQYRENLMRIIQGKLQGKEVPLEAPGEPRQAEVVDLMERLRRSLAQSRARGGAPARKRGAKTRSRRGAPRARKKHAA